MVWRIVTACCQSFFNTDDAQSSILEPSDRELNANSSSSDISDVPSMWPSIPNNDNFHGTQGDNLILAVYLQEFIKQKQSYMSLTEIYRETRGLNKFALQALQIGLRRDDLHLDVHNWQDLNTSDETFKYLKHVNMSLPSDTTPGQCQTTLRNKIDTIAGLDAQAIRTRRHRSKKLLFLATTSGVLKILPSTLNKDIAYKITAFIGHGNLPSIKLINKTAYEAVTRTVVSIKKKEAL